RRTCASRAGCARSPGRAASRAAAPGGPRARPPAPGRRPSSGRRPRRGSRPRADRWTGSRTRPARPPPPRPPDDSACSYRQPLVAARELAAAVAQLVEVLLQRLHLLLQARDVGVAVGAGLALLGEDRVLHLELLGERALELVAVVDALLQVRAPRDQGVLLDLAAVVARAQGLGLLLERGDLGAELLVVGDRGGVELVGARDLGVEELLGGGIGLLALGDLVAHQEAEPAAHRRADGRALAVAADGVADHGAEQRADAGAFGLGARGVVHVGAAEREAGHQSRDEGESCGFHVLNPPG